MKRLILGLLLAVLLAAAPGLQAYQMTVLPHDFAKTGDEYIVHPLDSWPVDLAGYSNLTKNLFDPTPNFQTFCLENTENSYPGPSYVTFDTGAIQGGAGGGNPDPLSIGSAWLYEQFATGILSGYNYLTNDSGRRTTSINLQQAFWYLEDETGLVDPLLNPFLALVDAKFGLASAKLDNNNAYGVWVINPYHFENQTTNDGQRIVYDQSYLVLVPEPGTLILLGTGLFGLAFAVRRRKK